METGPWSEWVMVLIAALVFASGLITGVRSRRKRLMTFKTLFNQPLSDPRWKNLTLELDGRKLDSPHQALVVFRNSGTVPLKVDDISDPLGLGIGSQGSFVHAVATEVAGGSRSIEVPVQLEEKTVIVPSRLLNPGDELFVQVILNQGSTSEDIKVLGKASGFEIRESDEFSYGDGILGRLRSTWQQHQVSFVLVAVTICVAAGYMLRGPSGPSPSTALDNSPTIKVVKVDTDENYQIRLHASDSASNIIFLGAGPPTYWAFINVNDQIAAATSACESTSQDDITCTVAVNPISPGKEITCWVARVSDDLVPILKRGKTELLTMQVPDSLTISQSDPFVTTVGRYVITPTSPGTSSTR